MNKKDETKWSQDYSAYRAAGGRSVPEVGGIFVLPKVLRFRYLGQPYETRFLLLSKIRPDGENKQFYYDCEVFDQKARKRLVLKRWYFVFSPAMALETLCRSSTVRKAKR